MNSVGIMNSIAVTVTETVLIVTADGRRLVQSIAVKWFTIYYLFIKL